jgi:hypothetical protein
MSSHAQRVTEDGSGGHCAPPTAVPADKPAGLDEPDLTVTSVSGIDSITLDGAMG